LRRNRLTLSERQKPLQQALLLTRICDGPVDLRPLLFRLRH
jgi:hypothetical protein